MVDSIDGYLTKRPWLRCAAPPKDRSAQVVPLTRKGIKDRRPSPDWENMDEISAQSPDFIGRSSRLDIPLNSQYNLRRVADLGKGLMEQLDFISRRDDISKKEAMRQAQSCVRAVNQQLHGMMRKKGEEPY
jgi:hypothetical protein